jgi:O-antigen ligase
MQTIRRIPYYGSLLLLAYMPFHVFLSQSLSLITGGLDEWKVAKDVLLAILCLLTVGLVWWERKATKLFNGIVAVTVLYSLLNIAIWALHPHAVSHTSNLLGFTYDVRLFGYLVVGYGAVLLTTVDMVQVRKLLLVVSCTVAALGVLQYFLPSGLLTHLGYSVQRGVLPNFFIDDNPEFPRIMSTVRDPNSLGAYLVLPIALLSAMVLRARTQRRRMVLSGLLVLQLVAVYLTFSRSAWAAALIVMVLVAWWQYRKWVLQMSRRFWPILIALVVLIGAGAYSQRHNPIISHETTMQRAGTRDSNQAHLYRVEHSIQGIEHEPLGHGPGTAGLASVHTVAGANLTENYYLQVGYETGVLGLLIFVGMQVFLYVRLWPQRHNYLGLALLTSFWAYVIINLVLQQWDNEAVAAQWWIVAGLLVGYTETKTTARMERN